MIRVFHAPKPARGGKMIALIVSDYDSDGAASLCGIREVGDCESRRKNGLPGNPDTPRRRPVIHCHAAGCGT